MSTQASGSSSQGSSAGREQTTESKVRKKKKKAPFPNPLFLAWLQEWLAEAKSRGWKTKYIYAKAIASLKKYPLPLSSGEECKILQYFGDKICKQVDDRLKEYRERGETLPVSGQGATQDLVPTARSTTITASAGRVQKKISSAKTVKGQQNTPSTSGSNSMNPSRSEQNISSANIPTQSQSSTLSQERKRVSASQREYIPQYGSGSYALLMSLYKYELDPDSESVLTKTELLKKAQELCSVSMTIPPAGSYYTGWSSMSTLLKKKLVERIGQSKFRITGTGCELAHKLYTADSDRSMFSVDKSIFETDRLDKTLCSASPGKDNSPQKSMSESVLSDSESNQSVAPEIDRLDGISPRIPSLRERLGLQRTVSDQDMFDSGHDTDPCKLSHSPSNAEDTGSNSALSSQASVESCPPTKKTRANGLTVLPKTLSDTALPSTSALYDGKVARTTGVPTRRKIPLIRHESEQSLTSSQGSSVASEVNGCEEPVFVFEPGTFDIVLCVDNCEYYGTNSKQSILPELMRNGVHCDVRKLSVGDFLWVAKEKGQAIPGQLHLPNRRELVLNYIIERKRMDDLASSVMDGRFREQKFRLKNCGIRCPIYLVEEYTRMPYLGVPRPSLEQAITNTQVIDGFFIKRTANVQESVGYLTVMTRYLQSSYSSKRLIASRQVSEEHNKFELEASEVKLMPFAYFNKSSVKNKNITVREMFAKQLMQFHGLSLEKVTTIIEKYPTLMSLLRAYDSQESNEAKERLLAELKSSTSQSSIGLSLSKQVFTFYNAV